MNVGVGAEARLGWGEEGMAGEEVEAASVSPRPPRQECGCERGRAWALGRGMGLIEGFFKGLFLCRWEHSGGKPESEGMKETGVSPPSDAPDSSSGDEESPALGHAPRPSAPPRGWMEKKCRAWVKEARRGGPALALEIENPCW